jgi:hypothetical protein
MAKASKLGEKRALAEGCMDMQCGLPKLPSLANNKTVDNYSH